MNKRILQRYTMLKMVMEYCNEHKNVTDVAPAFAEIAGRIQIKLEEYKNLQVDCSEDTTVFTEKKKSARLALEKQLNYVMAAACTYAVVEQDYFLELNVAYTPTFVRRLRDFELLSYVGNVYNLVNPYLKDMKKYGLTAEKLEELLHLKDNFYAMISVPRLKRNNVRNAIRQAEACIDKAMDIMNRQLDCVARIIGFDDEQWYAGYLICRKQVKMRTSHTQIKLAVVDEQGMALKNSTINVKFEDTQIQGLTDKDGMFELEGVKQGDYMINIAKEGFYKMDLSPFRLKLGENKKIKVEMKQVVDEMMVMVMVEERKRVA